MSRFPNVAVAQQYARDIVSGKIVACRYVRLACQRHLDDLGRIQSDDWPYYFCEASAERMCKFVQFLPHTKGEWAFQRRLITLSPWQLFGYCVIFGWKFKTSKLRRFRESYKEIPRKNGKSVMAAGVGHYMFCADNEYGAEVYAGATTEKQAWEVFRPARLMAKKSSHLIDAYGIEVNAKSMMRALDGARFEPIIGDPGDGASPSCALVDEYHEHETANQYETMITGMGARRQPLMYTITTAGDNIAGPCFDMRRRVIDMLEGTVPDEQLFGIIYTIDEDDDWSDPAVLAKANPNIVVSVYAEYLAIQQQRAVKNARLANKFKTKHLNIWVSAKSAFFNMETWRKAEDLSLCVEKFEGQSCILGFDLARKLDINFMARLFYRDIDGRRHYYSVSPRAWVPEDTVFDNENIKTSERYQTWVNSGHLITTDGAEIDYREILAEAVETNLNTPVLASAVDPHGATALSHQLDDEGLSPITITQNYTNLSDPMKELEAAIMSGRFHHDGHPILTWCISNVIAKYLPGNDDVIRPIKQGDDNKIDGAVALIMAISRAMPSNDMGGDINDFLSNPIVIG